MKEKLSDRGIALSERVELNRESSPTNRETADGENSLLLIASDNQATMIKVDKQFFMPPKMPYFYLRRSHAGL